MVCDASRGAGGGGGQVACLAVPPYVEVRSIRGHPLAGVGVLLGPHEVDELEAVVLCAGGVEEIGQGLVPPRLAPGPLFPLVVVEVLLLALVEVLLTAAGQGSSLSGKGWCGP